MALHRYPRFSSRQLRSLRYRITGLTRYKNYEVYRNGKRCTLQAHLHNWHTVLIEAINSLSDILTFFLSRRMRFVQRHPSVVSYSPTLFTWYHGAAISRKCCQYKRTLNVFFNSYVIRKFQQPSYICMTSMYRKLSKKLTSHQAVLYLSVD